MRLSDLMKMESFDADGGSLDHVSDVRLEQRDEGWVVTHVAVGRAAFAERLGFIHGVVERPALLAWVLRRVARRARMARWDQVSVAGGTLKIAARRDDLPRPEGS